MVRRKYTISIMQREYNRMPFHEKKKEIWRASNHVHPFCSFVGDLAVWLRRTRELGELAVFLDLDGACEARIELTVPRCGVVGERSVRALETFVGDGCVVSAIRLRR